MQSSLTMAATYALPTGAAPSSTSSIDRRPSRTNLTSNSSAEPSHTWSNVPLDPTSQSHSEQRLLSSPQKAQIQFQQNGSSPYATSRSSSNLSGLVGKLPFRSSSVDDMNKGRPRGESDLGRPGYSSRASLNNYGLSSIPDSDDESCSSTSFSSPVYVGNFNPLHITLG